MALEQCTVDGKPGYRWGNGKCHTGRHGKERAEAEGATEIVGDQGKIEKGQHTAGKSAAHRPSEAKAKVETKVAVEAKSSPKKEAPAKKKAAAKKK